MKESSTESNGNSHVGDMLTKSEQFIERNSKKLILCAAVVAVAAVAFFGLRRYYFQPREVEASEELFAAENWFDQGMFEQALNGDSASLGFLDIIDSYGRTKAGNLARYYAAVCQLNLGRYDEALQLLDRYKGRDLLTRVEAEMLRGDAEAELEHYDAALRHYEKAAGMNANMATTPAARFKAALVLLHQGENARAVEQLELIRREYPESTEANEVDKYIGYAEAKQ
ncbi:MAG: Tetratricopeptide repeat-containing protein [bacterium P3]|nr:MAG: Tetratricopeptide repeat-containing protein [bacterium P3]KWW38906.1 MAG: Tetratricopeptide repeat-containing protein [bacterium F083]